MEGTPSPETVGKVGAFDDELVSFFWSLSSVEEEELGSIGRTKGGQERRVDRAEAHSPLGPDREFRLA